MPLPVGMAMTGLTIAQSKVTRTTIWAENKKVIRTGCEKKNTSFDLTGIDKMHCPNCLLF